MIFVGIDWAESHHDVCLLDEAGGVLAKQRIDEGIVGLTELQRLIAEHATEPAAVAVGIELDRGLLVGALVASGYLVYGINPLAASRYRERHVTSGAKSDAGDAKVLADLVRTDRQNHRPIAVDSQLSQALQVLARAHQELIWNQRALANHLRSSLREYFPAILAAFGNDLVNGEALVILTAAPTPTAGRALSRARIVSLLRRAGRQRNLEQKAADIQSQLRAQQLAAPPLVTAAYAKTTAASVSLLREMTSQIAQLEAELSRNFERHPDAEIYRSLPGLGVVLGARVLSEFGDDRTRFAHPKGRKNFAGTSPITRASGNRKQVLARFARNRRLADACHWWAFCALRMSPGARTYYHQLRSRGKSHHQALRSLANRLVGILHGCLDHGRSYQEEIAWPTAMNVAA